MCVFQNGQKASHLSSLLEVKFVSSEYELKLISAHGRRTHLIGIHTYFEFIHSHLYILL